MELIVLVVLMINASIAHRRTIALLAKVAILLIQMAMLAYTARNSGLCVYIVIKIINVKFAVQLLMEKNIQTVSFTVLNKLIDRVIISYIFLPHH